jgi:hypothetical protein
MVQPRSIPNREQVIDTMVALTRLSNQHRAIIGGSYNQELYIALRGRGFTRVAITVTCAASKGQHTIGLIISQSSLQTIKALDEVSRFLSAEAAIAVLIDSRECGLSLKVRARLEQMGFRIEAGVRCQQGLVLSAYRQGFGQMELAA